MSDTSNNLSPALEALANLGNSLRIFADGYRADKCSLPSSVITSDNCVIVQANGNEVLRISRRGDAGGADGFARALLTVMEMACQLDHQNTKRKPT